MVDVFVFVVEDKKKTNFEDFVGSVDVKLTLLLEIKRINKESREDQKCNMHIFILDRQKVIIIKFVALFDIYDRLMFFVCIQCKDIVKTLKELLPRAKHRFCVHHMYINFKKQFPGKN